MAAADGPRRHNGRVRVALAVAVVLAGVAVLALVGVVLAWRLPPPTGPLAVGTTLLEMTDRSRAGEAGAGGAGRELVAQVWYPAAASTAPVARYRRWSEAGAGHVWQVLLRTHSRWNAPVAETGAPLPVLLFGHRWNGERTQDTALAEDLASYGYVVVAVDHPGNTSRVRLGSGRVVKAAEDLDQSHSVAQTERQWDRELAVWTADDSFAVTELARQSVAATGLFAGRLKTDAVGAFGHSFGGAAALRLCGSDARVRAAVNLDGWTLGGLSARTAGEAVMVMYGVPADGAVPGAGESALVAQIDAADKAVVDASLAAYGGDEVQVRGAQHLDFTDQPLLPPFRRGGFTGPIAPLRMQQILRTAVRAFFDAKLRGQPGDAGGSLAGFSEVSVERHSPNGSH